MTPATILQLVRIAFMVGGSYITAKTGLTFEDVETATNVLTVASGPVVAAVGALWSLYAGIKARKAAQ